MSTILILSSSIGLIHHLASPLRRRMIFVEPLQLFIPLDLQVEPKKSRLAPPSTQEPDSCGVFAREASVKSQLRPAADETSFRRARRRQQVIIDSINFSLYYPAVMSWFSFLQFIQAIAWKLQVMLITLLVSVNSLGSFIVFYLSLCYLQVVLLKTLYPFRTIIY